MEKLHNDNEYENQEKQWFLTQLTHYWYVICILLCLQVSINQIQVSEVLCDCNLGCAYCLVEHPPPRPFRELDSSAQT